MPASVQFYGPESVLTACENRSCPAWAIFQGKQFLFKYEGNDQEESLALLEQILGNLKHSSAIYTLQFYEDATRIKANTPHDGSFNFRLIDEQEKAQRAEIYQSRSNAVLNKLDAIENRLAALEDPGDDDDDQGGIFGILQDPQRLGAITQGLQIFASLLGVNKPQQPAAIAGINQPDMQNEQIKQAVDRLAAADPQLAQHLAKLADLAEKDPATFKWLINMLEKM